MSKIEKTPYRHAVLCTPCKESQDLSSGLGFCWYDEEAKKVMERINAEELTRDQGRQMVSTLAQRARNERDCHILGTVNNEILPQIKPELTGRSSFKINRIRS